MKINDLVKIGERTEQHIIHHAAEYDDDGNIIDVAEDGRDVAVYYTYNGTAGTEPEGSVFFYETETTDSSGKRIVTASGTSFKETAVTAEQFDASTQSYFVLEDPVPSFSVEYREVYL